MLDAQNPFVHTAAHAAMGARCHQHQRNEQHDIGHLSHHGLFLCGLAQSFVENFPKTLMEMLTAEFALPRIIHAVLSSCLHEHQSGMLL